MRKDRRPIVIAKVASLFDRDTILHLRIPFSFFLLPVFVFGVSQAVNIHLADTAIVFIALHLFIYPGSNVYNSYMDKDTGSIGGLRNPPPVTKKLYYASIIVDLAGFAICAISSIENALVMCGYIAFSKAYSWDGIRLKKYPYLGWALVAFFQGGYTFMLANMAAEHAVNLQWFTAQHLECMLIASFSIGGYYPLTQIYQHEEDGRRGDHTISYRLGIKGTFLFTATLFLLTAATAFHYFTTYYSWRQFAVFACCMAPAVFFLTRWAFRAAKDNAYADYNHAMLMNKIASAGMVTCFTIILWLNNKIG